METSDLLSILSRMRKPQETAVVPVTDTEAEEDVEPSADAVPDPDEPADTAVPDLALTTTSTTAGGSGDGLAELEDELRADEILLRRILGLLYRAKKKNPNGGAVSILTIEKDLAIPREGGDFIMAYMKSVKLVQPDDKSRLQITVTGINYLRQVLQINNGYSTGSGDSSLM